MLTGLLLGLWLMIAIGRETPVGRLLHRWMVEWPCRKLAGIKQGQVLFAILMLTLTVGLVWLLEDHGRMLIAFGGPDVFAFAVAIDLSSLLDLAAMAVIAAGTVRIRAIRTWLTQRIAPATRPRARSIRTRRPLRSSNDDEDRPPFALAA